MQVLVRNPHGSRFRPQNVVESFWSKDSLYLGPTFAMTSLLELNDPKGLSPFLVLDARIAFYIDQLELADSLITKNLGPLGTVGAHLKTNAKIYHNEDPRKFDRYVKEFLPENPVKEFKEVGEVIVYNETSIDKTLWSRLKKGGYYLIASGKEPLEIDPPGKFEVIKESWPAGMETEVGWRFVNEDLGLENFEFAKIRKLD